MTHRFEGRTVLVTGGAMGIGAATVRRLVEEGASVILADIDPEAARATAASCARPDAVVIQAVDLSDPESVEAMGREVAGRFPALRGLVNACGIKTGSAVAETGDRDWEPQVSINLRAPALCVKALLPLLKAGPGHIVNLSSNGAFTPHRKGSWVYDATKAGICAVTRAMASELAPYGIRANTVAPGWTVTEMHYKSAADPAARKLELEETRWDAAMLGRLARPREIAAVIVFLLSDDASFMTSSTVHVDGGSTAN